MFINEKIMVNKDSLEKIQIKLRGLKVMVEDKEIQSLVSDILGASSVIFPSQCYLLSGALCRKGKCFSILNDYIYIKRI